MVKIVINITKKKKLYEKKMKPSDRIGTFLNLPLNKRGGKVKSKKNPYNK